MSTKSISLTALRAFDAAARQGAFKAAARELGVTPTAVSHQIRALESQLGVALFDRLPRKIELTTSGAALAEATTSAFQRIDDALRALELAERRLTISTTPAFGSLWLVPRLAAFEAAHPELHVHVETTTAAVDLHRDRHIDLAIRYGPRADHPQLLCQPVAEETFGAYASPELLDTLGELSDATLLETTWKAPGLPAITWDRWLAARGLDETHYRKRRTFFDEQHGVQAALAGQGVLLASALLVGDMVSRGWLRAFEASTTLPGLRYTAVARPTSAESRKVRAFFEWLCRESPEASGETRRPSSGRAARRRIC